MSYECTIDERPAQPALVMRLRTSVDRLPELMGKTYGAIAGWLAELGESPAGPPFVAYYNMDMGDLDVEVGFPVAKSLPGRGDIRPTEMPAGSFAACRFRGPYSELPHAYEALTRWVTEAGKEPTGVAYEIYLNDPSVTPPDELETEILFPLESR